MQIMPVGKFKAKFSEVIAQVLAGKSVGISCGKKKKPIAVVNPFRYVVKKTYKKTRGLLSVSFQIG